MAANPYAWADRYFQNSGNAKDADPYAFLDAPIPEQKPVVQQPAEEKKDDTSFFDKAGNTLSSLGRLAYDLPVQTKGYIANLAEGSHPLDDKNWADDWAKEAEQRTKERVTAPDAKDQTLLGTKEDWANTSASLPFSLGSMGGALVGSAAGTLAAPFTEGVSIPVGAMAGAGIPAYQADKAMFVRQALNGFTDKFKQQYDREPTHDELLAEQERLQSYATEHGIAEAVPEAIGSAIGAKVIKGVFGDATSGLVKKGAKALGGIAAEELPSETVTQQLQHNIESDAGVTGEEKRSYTNPSDWYKSFKEVAIPTIQQSVLMGGGTALASKAFDYAKGLPNQQTQTPPTNEAPLSTNETPVELPTDKPNSPLGNSLNTYLNQQNTANANSPYNQQQANAGFTQPTSLTPNVSFGNAAPAQTQAQNTQTQGSQGQSQAQPSQQAQQADVANSNLQQNQAARNNFFKGARTGNDTNTNQDGLTVNESPIDSLFNQAKQAVDNVNTKIETGEQLTPKDAENIVNAANNLGLDTKDKPLPVIHDELEEVVKQAEKPKKTTGKKQNANAQLNNEQLNSLLWQSPYVEKDEKGDKFINLDRAIKDAVESHQYLIPQGGKKFAESQNIKSLADLIEANADLSNPKVNFDYSLLRAIQDNPSYSSFKVSAPEQKSVKPRKPKEQSVTPQGIKEDKQATALYGNKEQLLNSGLSKQELLDMVDDAASKNTPVIMKTELGGKQYYGNTISNWGSESHLSERKQFINSVFSEIKNQDRAKQIAKENQRASEESAKRQKEIDDKTNLRNAEIAKHQKPYTDAINAINNMVSAWKKEAKGMSNDDAIKIYGDRVNKAKSYLKELSDKSETWTDGRGITNRDNKNARLLHPSPKQEIIDFINQGGLNANPTTNQPTETGAMAQPSPEISPTTTAKTNAGSATDTLSTATPQSNKQAEAKGKRANTENQKPSILTKSKKAWIKEQSKGLKEGTAGYKNAIAQIEDSYDKEVDKALASLPFDEFANHPLNNGASPSVLRESYDQLRAEFYPNQPEPTAAPQTKEIEKSEKAKERLKKLEADRKAKAKQKKANDQSQNEATQETKQAEVKKQETPQQLIERLNRKLEVKNNELATTIALTGSRSAQSKAIKKSIESIKELIAETKNEIASQQEVDSSIAEKSRAAFEEIKRKEAQAKQETDFTVNENGDVAANTQDSEKPLSEMEQVDADIDDVLGDIGRVLMGRLGRGVMPTDDSAELLPLMSKLMGLAVKKGYLTFKENARFVLDTIRAKLGDDIANTLDIDDLQAGYIAMKQGTTSKKEVVNYESIDELLAPELQEPATDNTANQDSNLVENDQIRTTETEQSAKNAQSLQKASNPSNELEQPELSSDEIVRLLAESVRKKNLIAKTNKDGIVGVFVGDTHIANLKSYPQSADEAAIQVVKNYRDALRAEGRTLSPNPYDMSRDEFLVANKFGKLLGDFEIDGSEIGSILTQDSRGFFQIDHDALYDKIQKQKENTAQSNYSEFPNSSKQSIINDLVENNGIDRDKITKLIDEFEVNGIVPTDGQLLDSSVKKVVGKNRKAWVTEVRDKLKGVVNFGGKAEATHTENGKVEPVTQDVVTDSLKTADESSPKISFKESKDELLRQIDAAIVVAPDELGIKPTEITEQPTQEEKPKSLQDLIRTQDLPAILDHIIDGKSSLSGVAQVLKDKLPSDLKFEVVPELKAIKDNSRDIPAKFLSATNTIQVSEKYLRSKDSELSQFVLHELAHAETVYALKNDSNGVFRSELNDIVDKIIAHVGGIDGILTAKDTKGNVREMFKVGRLINRNGEPIAEELVAYGLTDPRFQVALQEIAYSSDKSLWDKFVESIAKALGIPVRNGNNTALAAVLRLSTEIMEEQANNDARRQAALEFFKSTDIKDPNIKKSARDKAIADMKASDNPDKERLLMIDANWSDILLKLENKVEIGYRKDC